MPDPPPPPPRPDVPPASSPSSPPPPLANRPPRPAYASDNDYHYQRSLWARRPPPPTAPPPPPAPPTTPLLPPSRPPARRPSAASYAAPLPSSAASRALARSLSARASARAAFEADVDAVYFAHTDFATVLATDMRAVLAGDRSLGGVEPGVVRTRAQWRRVRRRMCEVFPAGCARPRRFSRSFLEGEREELGTFRRDARAVLRKAALGEAVDVHSGARLGRLWWQRYPFQLPVAPQRGCTVFLRLGQGTAAEGNELEGERVGRKRKKPVKHLQDAKAGEDGQVSVRHWDGIRRRFVAPTEGVRYVAGKFLSIAPNGKVTVHVNEDVLTVPDLSVMSVVPPVSSSVADVVGADGGAKKPSPAVDSLPEPVVTHLQVTAAAVSAGASLRRTPQGKGSGRKAATTSNNGPFSSTSVPVASDAHRAIAASAAADPSAMLLPPPTPQALSPSPRKGLALKSRIGPKLEYEIHVRAVAEAVRLLDTKEKLLKILRSSNDAAEKAVAEAKAKAAANVSKSKPSPLATTLSAQLGVDAPPPGFGSATQDAAAVTAAAEKELMDDAIPDSVRKTHVRTLDSLAVVNARLDVVLPGMRAQALDDQSPSGGSVTANHHAALAAATAAIAMPFSSRQQSSSHPSSRYGSGSISAPDFGGGGSHSTSVRLDGHVDGGGGGAGVEMGVALGSENWLAHRLFRQHEEMLRMQQLPNASDSASREDEGIGGGSRAVGLTSPVPLPAPFGGPTPGPQTGDAAVSPPMDLILPPVPPYLAAPPGSGSVCTSPPPPPPGMHRSLKRARDASVAGLRPEYQAKNVDFRTSGGAALLAKALARQALGQLPEEDKLKNCGAPLRADVIECVSACVSLIIRARATRSSESAEDLIDALRVKCPENEHLIVNIKNAVREFDDTSTDSR